MQILGFAIKTANVNVHFDKFCILHDADAERLGIQNSKQDMRQQDMLKAVPKNRPNPSKD
jgi:hypothetical protein